MCTLRHREEQSFQASIQLYLIGYIIFFLSFILKEVARYKSWFETVFCACLSLKTRSAAVFEDRHEDPSSTTKLALTVPKSSHSPVLLGQLILKTSINMQWPAIQWPNAVPYVLGNARVRERRGCPGIEVHIPLLSE